ncbi:hypothetical protein MTBBW1_260004 [Desulfamplus magnetovallimortis]|uniref:Uncharacterized protein n=1 Tax=Desulfamplus magnetovallimortis TaxID=1246637 RepID=A0A1W1HF03_9BACT|nr:hypothetical protein [Desulfamplus magnetovallimortis]SLM31003.1 hypothetical protein MTBBW1_260004 [Desulfamplus magnetovallimortis]
MKKARTRYIKNNDGTKKSVLKFREGHDEDLYEDEDETLLKQKKDVGKRLHRKKTVKDDFWDSGLINKN